jgi:hypothetical protein
MKVLAVFVFVGILLCLSACALTPPLKIPEGAVKYSGTVWYSGTDISPSLTAWLVDDGTQLRGIYTLLNDPGPGHRRADRKRLSSRLCLPAGAALRRGGDPRGHWVAGHLPLPGCTWHRRHHRTDPGAVKSATR